MFRRIGVIVVMLCAVLMVSPALSGEVAVVDIPGVISKSAPGKAAQKYVDALQAELQKVYDQYAKTEKDPAKIEIRRVELDHQYNVEHARVSGLVADRLRTVTDKWLKSNKKGVTIILPKSAAVAVSAKADISNEILKLFNKETIKF